MPAVQRSVRQKVVAGAAVAVLVGGASFAAVSATGHGNRNGNGDGHRRKHARHSHSARRLRTRDLAAAASYLGTTSGSLASELRTGKSLVQIAAAHGSGKTASGLVEAIVAERRARLQKTSANLPARVSRAGAHSVSAARSKRRAERLHKRVERLVARKFLRGSSP
jgi:hypothetical protein